MRGCRGGGARAAVAILFSRVLATGKHGLSCLPAEFRTAIPAAISSNSTKNVFEGCAFLLLPSTIASAASQVVATFLHQWWDAWTARGVKIIRTTCVIQKITVAVLGKSNKCSGEPLENMISELANVKMHAIIGNEC
jgi:hypothetical protein